MSAARRGARPTACALLLLAACTPARFEPRPIDTDLARPAAPPEWSRAPGGGADQGGSTDDAATAASARMPEVHGELRLSTVLTSVTERYPPYLAELLERDLASGRVLQAMGAFDTSLSAKLGGRLQGYYEHTFAQGLLEQPLATGDTIYGGYRISDGFLPDYDKNRTQDDGEFVFGGRFPLLQGRSIDPARASVRKAEIDSALAEPQILAARIGYVQKATSVYYKWAASGRKLAIARELLRLAEARRDGLTRAVERQFLAPIALTDNDRLIAQRTIYVTRAERAFQAASLELSLFLRDDSDRPIVATERNLPVTLPPAPPLDTALEEDLQRAAVARPDLAALQLKIAKAETDRDLADNQTLADLDLIVEAASSPVERPYTDREHLELFVGGELKLPLQRRSARGALQRAEAELNRLQLQQRFARDRISNEILDARSAILAAGQQLEDTRRNVDLADQLVAAEQRAFDLGRSDLLRVQLREAQLADARVMAIDAELDLLTAVAGYRAALGYAGE